MKRIIVFSILTSTFASCGGFKHRQIVFQKEKRKQIIVENKKQESPIEFTPQKKEFTTSTIDILASLNNNLEEEVNNQSINIEVEYNSPSLISEVLKKNTKSLKKNKKRDLKKGLKTNWAGIVGVILSILGTVFFILGANILPLSDFGSLGFLLLVTGIPALILGIKSLVKKSMKYKNRVWSIFSVVLGCILTVLGVLVLVSSGIA